MNSLPLSVRIFPHVPEPQNLNVQLLDASLLAPSPPLLLLPSRAAPTSVYFPGLALTLLFRP